MTRIALVKLGATYSDWYKRPVISLGYLKAILDEAGFEAKIFDAYFHRWPESELVSRIEAFEPRIVGMTAMTNEITRAASLAATLKSRLDVVTMVGGCHVTALPERTLQEFEAFDFGVIDEGERTAPELVQAIVDGAGPESLGRIQGIVFRQHDSVQKTPRRPLLTSSDLDSLPYPDYSDYTASDEGILGRGRAVYPIYSTRGCPYKCAFCQEALGTKKVRQRSPENVVKEFELAVTRFSARTIVFADDIFLYNSQRTRDLLQGLIDTGLAERARWYGQIRADMVNQEVIGLAKRAGCYRVGVGVESGDDEILEASYKGITTDQARHSFRTIRAAGLEIDAFFIIGHPNETRASATRTVDFVAELNPDSAAIGLMVPFPGTIIHEMAVHNRGGYRLLTEDWARYEKYGSQALELAGLTHREMVRLQRRAYWKLYIQNRRILDLCRLVWERRSAVRYFLARRLGIQAA